MTTAVITDPKSRHSALACVDCGRPIPADTLHQRRKTGVTGPYRCQPCKRVRVDYSLPCDRCGRQAPVATRSDRLTAQEKGIAAPPYRCNGCRSGNGVSVRAGKTPTRTPTPPPVKAEKAAKHVRTKSRLCDSCPPGKLPGTLVDCGGGVWAIRVESNQTEGQESVGALSSREAAVAVAERRGICLLWEEG